MEIKKCRSLSVYLCGDDVINRGFRLVAARSCKIGDEIFYFSQPTISHVLHSREEK